MITLKKFTFFILFISAGFQGWSQGDLILWGTKDLTWSDFKGAVPNNTGYHALTNSQIRVTNELDQDSLHLEVTTKFVRSKSWVKKTRNADLLKHEQLHFDITEYCARLFRKAVLESRFSSYRNVGKKIGRLFKKFHKKARSIQSKYDRQSDHSRNAEGQKKWNQQVPKYLNETKAYASIKIDLYIGYLR